jgi:excisionase family DNA binding protein
VAEIAPPPVSPFAPSALLIRCEEAARLLGVHTRTITREADRGRLIAVGTRGKRRILASSIQAYLNLLVKESGRPGKARNVGTRKAVPA